MCYTTTMYESLLLSPATAVLARKRSRAQAQCTSEPNTKTHRVVRSVRFAAFATQYETTSTGNTWYSPYELASFKLNMRRDVLHIANLCKQKRINDVDRTEYSPIGLEKYCCSIAEQNHMKYLRIQRIHAVLEQQFIQRQMGLSMPEPLREVSQTFSSPVVAKALARANKLCSRRS